eukprot:TRINITY_DN6680_c0_g1_i2.p1 TRINITY_DN6680_c0_g1~~TRINITY_DN6680_c0_g1_i2.p1  ORF type:complete len:444 (-),score=59.91 TRINITY_DN6680_c0_g1_i2:458-1789(-)
MAQMQTSPWPQQQCFLAIALPAEHFQGSLPAGAVLVPVDPFQNNFQGPFAVPAEQVQGSCQGELPQAFLHPQRQPMCPQVFQGTLIQPHPVYKVGSADHQSINEMFDAAMEVTTLGSCSDKDSTSDQEREASACRPRLTTSAARRLRRKRAVERFAGKLGKAGALVPGPVHGPCCQATQNFSSDVYDDLRLKLSEGSRRGVEDTLEALHGQVWSVSQDPLGCRLVQLALERIDHQEAAELVRELHGHVQEAATSPHANYVLQMVVSRLTFDAAKFVAEELVGSCGRLARHRFGCRILCRLVEFFGSQSLVQQLINELLCEADDLCCHSFAHHVVQSVIENGDDLFRRRVAAALLTDPLGYAQHKNASYLVERALSHCCQEDRQALLAHLSRPDTIAHLAETQYGRYVAKALLQQEATMFSKHGEHRRRATPAPEDKAWPTPDV